MIEIASLLLSIFAIVVSICTAICEYKTNKYMANKGLEATYYQKIFDDFLINRIPEGRKKLVFNYKLENADFLVNSLSVLKRKIIYFRYRDKDFYSILNKQITKLEDYLVTVNNQEIDSIAITDILIRIDGYIDKLYEIIFQNYHY